jgi:hypothetical protein
MRNKVLIFLAAVLAAFALGYFPQYFQRRSLESQLAACRGEVELAGIRTLAGWVFLETSRKNFGLAAGHAGRLFNRVREISGRAESSSRRALFEEVLSRRDAVTAGLAKADPGVAAEVQALYERVMETARP